MKRSAPVLYLDLDGTLLDVSERYYRLHCRLARDSGRPPLARDVFWTGKRRRLSLEALLPDWDERCREEYARRWAQEIESPAYIRFDTLVPRAQVSLAQLAQEHKLILATLRRDGQELRRQLQRLDIAKWFNQVMAAGDRGAGELTKARLLQEAGSPGGSSAVVVGDSEEDILAARALECPVVAVLSGIRERSFLETLRPDLIIESLAELPAVLPSLAPARAAAPSVAIRPRRR